jgi:protein-L-isoaspartate(D-aspartate) O-methyltransferase
MSHGIPSIALSQAMTYFHDEVVAHWETAEHFGPGIVRRLLEIGWPKDVVMNVNFPPLALESVTEVEVTRQGFRDSHMRSMEKRTDLRGRDYYWTGFVVKPSKPAEGTDLKAVYEGQDLGHAAAHRPDPQPDGGGPEGRAGRHAAPVRAARARGGFVMAQAKADTPEARLKTLMAALRAQGVTDPAVLAAIEKTPRDLFTPDLFKERSWEDSALPIACGQTISQPFIVGLMTQALTLEPRCRVLEIGTGSGYQTAVLSRVSRLVYTIERYRTLMKEAEARFAVLGLTNVITKFGDGWEGWPKQAPFDRILVTAAAQDEPETLLSQLKPQGVLVAPVGKGPVQSLRRYAGDGKGGFTVEVLCDVRFVPILDGVARE